ncbi:hypothetical protein Tco_0264861 [Tanacetum coccineum]
MCSVPGIVQCNLKHLKEVKRIFHYLQGTVNTGLWYTKDSGFELTGFSDADYAGCKDTLKSTSGGAQFLGEKLVSWSSKKQDYTALSTTKAEYIPIYCDSKSAIAISCNPVQHSRTKHIAVRYHFIYEHVEKGTIELYFVKTDYQLADLFTKALPVDRFKYLVRRLGMRSLSPQELDLLAKSQSYALSWKPCQGDSLNRPHHSLILAESRFKTSCSIDKDKYMMKAQARVSKSSAISDVQALPQKNIFDKLLASFQDIEHEVGDTRTQGSNPTWGDLKITVNTLVYQHREAVGEPKKASHRGTQVYREVVMMPEFFEEIDNKQSLSSIQEVGSCAFRSRRVNFHPLT